MDLLQPVDWDHIARKDDVAAVRGELDALRSDLVALEHRLSSKIDQMRAEFFKSQEARTRLVVFGMITMVVVVAALAFGAARLA